MHEHPQDLEVGNILTAYLTSYNLCMKQTCRHHISHVTQERSLSLRSANNKTRKCRNDKFGPPVLEFFSKRVYTMDYNSGNINQASKDDYDLRARN